MTQKATAWLLRKRLSAKVFFLAHIAKTALKIPSICCAYVLDNYSQHKLHLRSKAIFEVLAPRWVSKAFEAIGVYCMIQMLFFAESHLALNYRRLSSPHCLMMSCLQSTVTQARG
jgi:hypothetical protein